MDNDSTAFTLLLYPVGFMILINPQPQSPVRPEYKKRECLLNQHQQSTIYSLLYNKLKTNTMSQWISIEAAAEKYRLEKELYLALGGNEKNHSVL